jgi:hypothetical protein
LSGFGDAIGDRSRLLQFFAQVELPVIDLVARGVQTIAARAVVVLALLTVWVSTGEMPVPAMKGAPRLYQVVGPAATPDPLETRRSLRNPTTSAE